MANFTSSLNTAGLSESFLTPPKSQVGLAGKGRWEIGSQRVIKATVWVQTTVKCLWYVTELVHNTIHRAAKTVPRCPNTGGPEMHLMD